LVREGVTGILSGKRNCFREIREGIFSGGRNCFSAGENRDIFRWEKLFQGWWEEGYFQVGDTVSGMVITGTFSGGRNCFRDADNRDIFR
jgi:hypothetical protein